MRRRLNVDVDIASPPKNFDNFEQKKIQTFYFGQGVEFYSQLFLLDFFSFGIRLWCETEYDNKNGALWLVGAKRRKKKLDRLRVAQVWVVLL